MSNDLAVRTRGVQLANIDDVARVSRMFAESGFFTDAREAAQCGVKIMAGAAWGIDPFTSMVGIHIIQNKPTVSAGLMAAAVKGHPKYDYRVRERSSERCRIEFFEGSESLGVSEYTLDMAQRANLLSNATWKKFPEAMLFARAMSSGVRAFTPDVFQASVYTPEELGASVSEDGEVIDVPARSTPRSEAPVSEPESPPWTESPEPSEEARSEAPSASSGDLITPAQLKKLAILLKEHGVDGVQARAFFGWLLERDIGSSKELTKAEASRVIGWDSDQWQAALADYAVATAGGPPEEES